MPKDETGGAAFTLTEVMVAVVLMLLALSLLLAAFVSSTRSVALAQNHLVAMQFARSEEERIQTNAYDDIVATNAIFTNAFIRYTIDSAIINTNINKYKDITITVSWTNAAFSMRRAITNYMTICSD